MAEKRIEKNDQISEAQIRIFLIAKFENLQLVLQKI